ncbi:MAG TPA: 2-phospho-L-lactate guanylyltransferase [Galbitalea sp.]
MSDGRAGAGAGAWTIVIPVKGTSAAKSRLGVSERVAVAIALDTVAAAVAAVAADAAVGSPLGQVIVVTSRAVAADVESLGARVVLDPGSGLDAAVAAGIAEAGDGAVAVLLGDVPGLLPSELGDALVAAGRHPRSFVPDADGSGTVLIAARRSEDHAPAFGADSRALHAAAGYVELAIDASSGLRRDVDTPDQLDALAGRLGPRTVAALAAQTA